MSVTEYQFDLHFWNTQCGTIIDKTIPETKMTLIKNGYRGQLVYLPNSKEVTDVIIADHIEYMTIKLAKKGKTYEDKVEEGKNGENDKLGQCFPSAYCYSRYHTVEMTSGALGYIEPDSCLIYWLFGHPDNSTTDWKNYNNFKKNDNLTSPEDHIGLIYGDRFGTYAKPIIINKATGKKAKPNDKCPCGSDKKYKKCCG